MGTRNLAFFVCLLWFASAVCACDSPFSPETLVERLRIIGLRAEPPAVELADTLELDALVIDPTGEGRALTFSWAVCTVMIDDQASDIPCPGPDAYALPGDGPSTQLSIPELIAWAAEQGFELDPAQMGELPDEELVEFPLLIGLRVDAGRDSVRALKRIVLRLDEKAQVYTNPRILGLDLEDEPIGDSVPVLQLGEKISLHPHADEDSRDLFLPAGEQEEREEDLLFSWFSTVGEFSDQRTILDDDRSGEPLEVNEWSLPKEAEEGVLGDQRLWLILRDGRYGTDWMEFRFTIEP